MVGNQIEEGLLRDPASPAHRDRSPGPLLVAIALAGVAFGVMSVLDLPLLSEVLIALGVVIPLGVAAVVLGKRWSGARPSQALRSEIEARRIHEAGLESEIDAARASGAFDRWETGPEKLKARQP